MDTGGRLRHRALSVGAWLGQGTWRTERSTEDASRDSSRTVPIAIALITLLALALRLYEVTRPGLLLGVPEYDDAVYFGSAVRLIDGALPYRDFALVQPPGITLLLAPVALLSKLTGTDAGLAVARVLTACAGAASVWLCGRLVRYAGLVAVVVGCGILAIHPDAALSAQSVFLEPWLVMFTLLGALAAFSAGKLTDDTRRLAWAGVALGCACAVKIWAAVPVAVMILFLVRARRRRATRSFLTGFGGTVAITMGPFFVAAPRAFVDNVVVAQIGRVDTTRTALTYRLGSLFGLSDLALNHREIVAAAAVLFVVCAGVSLAAWRLGGVRPRPLELFALACGGLTFLMFIWPVDYYFHYAAFFGPFLALTLSLSVGRFCMSTGRFLRAREASPRVIFGLGAALVIGLSLLLLQGARVVRQHESALRGQGAPVAVARAIPPTACVLTDYPAYTVTTNRFASSSPGCSAMVDPIGTDYALSHGKNALTGAGSDPAVASAWLGAFRHAQYVWLSCAPPRAKACDEFTNRRIPWTPAILGYFNGHFRRIAPVNAYLYERDRR